MAKTNWQPGDTFTHTDANQLGTEINGKLDASGVMTQAEGEAGTATTARALTATALKSIILFFSEPKAWQGTTAQYNALATKDANRLYCITD